MICQSVRLIGPVNTLESMPSGITHAWALASQTVINAVTALSSTL
ncbi:Uncharacterised protein [Serratia quinivorans]|nr:Uncharacterised protein [Serratia quinivorans]CAI1021921.1 Uncharacterised protein [Serratia quinivorans]CAI2033705.1 Uncharacterised protein [Serratia quinivorans]